MRSWSLRNRSNEIRASNENGDIEGYCVQGDILVFIERHDCNDNGPNLDGDELLLRNNSARQNYLAILGICLTLTFLLYLIIFND